MKPAIILLALTSIALAQGPLTPPGAPGLTMRSLDEIEPRIPLNQTTAPGDAASVYKITRPGSYILTGNLKPPAGHHGILIALLVPGVVEVDMMGFTIDGSDAGPTASALCNNEVIAGALNFYKLRHGTIRGFAGTACLQAPGTAVTFVFQDIAWLMNGAGVSTTGRLLMSDSSITGGTGIPIQMGSNSVLSGVEISGSGAVTSPLISTGDHCALERVSLSWSFGESNSGSAVMLGPDSTVSGLTARINGGTFSGPVLGNTSGFTEVSGLTLELLNVTAPSASNSFSWGATNPGLLGTTYGGDGQISAQNCTFTSAVVVMPPSPLGYLENDLITQLTGATTAPSVVRVEANNFTMNCDIFVAGTATVSGAVVDVAASGTTIRANIRGGSVGVRLSSGTGNTVEGCNLIGLLVPAQAIQITSGVTNSLVRNNRAARLPAGGVLVQNNGGPTNFIAPVLTSPAMLSANTNPFANILH